MFELALGVGAVNAFPAPAVAPGGLLVVGHHTARVFVTARLHSPLPALDIHIPDESLGSLCLLHHQQHGFLALVFFTRGVELSLDLLFNLFGTQVPEFTVVALLALACELELTDVVLE